MVPWCGNAGEKSGGKGMIRINNICRQFGEEKVLDGFSLTLAENKVNVLVGPSGCGKTTLLRILCGLDRPDCGALEGVPDTVSMVFQEDRLIPGATVEENLRLAFSASRRFQSGPIETVRKLLEMTELEKDANKYPFELSGGMRKRAALARGFVPESGLVLLDEPLQAIDWALKVSLVSSFHKIWSLRPVTVVFVTHDIQEAAMMGDVIHVLKPNPMSVHATIENTLEKNKRVMYEDKIVAIEQKIYNLLIQSEKRNKKTVPNPKERNR